MCMTSVDAKPKRKSGFGYKLLRHDRDNGRMSTGYMNGTPQQVKIGMSVVDSSNDRIGLESSYTTYPSGFHIFTSKQGVRQFQDSYGWTDREVITVRVKYSQVVATGKQLRSNVVVAKEFTATQSLWIGR